MEFVSLSQLGQPQFLSSDGDKLVRLAVVISHQGYLSESKSPPLHCAILGHGLRGLSPHVKYVTDRLSG